MLRRIVILVIFIFFIFIFFIYQINELNSSIILKSNKTIEYLYKLLPNKNILKDENINSKIEYFIQLGVFAKQYEVDRIRAKTSLLGLNTNLKNHMLNGKLTTKIIIGPFNNKKLLDKACKLLKHNSIDYIIIN